MISCKGKKVFPLLLLFMTFFPLNAFSESVLVSTRFPDTKLAGKEGVAWYETGIMDQLFAAGHLVISTAANETAYHDSFEESTIRIAKNIGVSYLLEVRIDFSTDLVDENDPEQAVYRFYDVAGGKSLAGGVVPISDPDVEAMKEAGSLLASSVLDRF